MLVFSLLFSLFITICPSTSFICDGSTLYATIRNNLSGDFALVDDLENIDQGAFVVLNWKSKNIMLPISFQSGEITFRDNKWLWSYQDNEYGLHLNNPRFAQLLPSGKVVEHECIIPKLSSSGSMN
ncbi:hypothetical protein [Prochlorococcus sp. MIT 1341]|uniref:hypothetical protein n=1 Tax=Prochlorococcus sp. MIT 1341 TaxID=3096221 RepID=UPI002A74D68D|nr:hypothetical protein [Prochlorococcus sp. MIT 1341]